MFLENKKIKICTLDIKILYSKKIILLHNIEGREDAVIVELIINYPADDEGIRLFESKLAQFQSMLVMKCVDNLNIDSISKKELLNGIAEEVKNKFKMPI